MTLIFTKDFITLSDLYLAYKKAKTDSFFDNFHPCKGRYAEFESDLHNNLTKLHNTLINDEKISPWYKNDLFLGGYSYAPKSIDTSPWEDRECIHFRSIDQNEDWLNKYAENKNKKLPVSYRLIINATVEYQVISALWILKVGHKFESLLDKNLSYGNRLRRKHHPLEDFGPYNGELNLDSLGLFSPYFSAYRTWRQKGLDAMRDIVQSDNNATAITMDLTSFYHNTSPNFILRPSFLQKTEIQLNKDEKKLTQQLIDSIHTWYQKTPDFIERPEGALPVGLSASKIISNVLLYELDESVSKNINPEYYGRYVDDIFLVFKTPPKISTGDDVINYLSDNIDFLKVHKTKGDAPTITLRLNYASDCELKFTPSKQKIFSLSPKYGLDLVNQISSQIRAQSSEYRMLPAVPEDANSMAEKALLASSDASLIADALRKTDVVSIRRLGLSLLIRDLESYSNDLSRSEWGDIRKEFYGLVERYIITPKGIFDLSSYLSRIFQLMISNYDFNEAKNIIDKIKNCFDIITKTTEKNTHQKLFYVKKYFAESLVETALRSSTISDFEQWNALRRTIIYICSLHEHEYKSITKSKLQELSRNLLLSDLGVRPYKDYWFYSQHNDERSIQIPKSHSVNKILNLPLIRKFRNIASLKLPHWPAITFPTRPLSIPEIVMACPSTLDDSQLLKDFILGLRGAKTIGEINFFRTSDSTENNKIFIPNKTPDMVSIALTNFETTNTQFMQAISSNPDLTLNRYRRVNTLINDILKSEHKSDYIVFPECSLPRKWALNISMNLAKKKISFIAGIEYHKPTSKNEVRNDCLLSLVTKWPGYNSSFIFFQPKLNPAHSEELQLKKKSLKLFKPAPQDKLPIYIHGNYCIGILICSDLTNPVNRVRYQGKVDSLFVLEWNPDVKTFSSLVEGSAHDIHTFIIQVNNRAYGDSRVRAPYRLEYKRDQVRIKGGLVDYFVIAKIDYKSLRRFQKKGVMTDPKSEFKPTPIGFTFSSDRK
ncbi:RNA-directed DNA polymerase [Aeromonas jandaei]|uniref:RNA-directed DNA polymerase n=1 Tax=Aeromonas jandaei TaxID=650 RepID=UPI0019200EF5|nr:RNA-directed DNA polymerase [Aeromonas jandaei]MBL0596858.1 RNA-directed DNA polymerase [Aeromonas jandaei]